MNKGIIYIMSTAVDGLIKIGKTNTNKYEQRMAQLENNGYRNVTGLKREFAIEVDDYGEKELLLDSLFSRSRVSNTELFSLNINELIQLLSSFEGKVIYPEQETKNKIFENAVEAVQSEFIPNGTYTLNVKGNKGKGKIKAVMEVLDSKLTVKKGACVGEITKIASKTWLEFRNALNIKDGVTLEDFEASSPSMAAVIVLGHNANGWKIWKDKNGNYIDGYRKKIGDN